MPVAASRPGPEFGAASASSNVSHASAQAVGTDTTAKRAVRPRRHTTAKTIRDCRDEPAARATTASGGSPRLDDAKTSGTPVRLRSRTLLARSVHLLGWWRARRVNLFSRGPPRRAASKRRSFPAVCPSASATATAIATTMGSLAPMTAAYASALKTGTMAEPRPKKAVPRMSRGALTSRSSGAAQRPDAETTASPDRQPTRISGRSRTDRRPELRSLPRCSQPLRSVTS